MQGFEFGPNTGGDNKTVEVVGDNFTLRSSTTSIPDGGGSIYINDFAAPADPVTVNSYHIIGNLFGDGTSIDIASGPGSGTALSGTNREIRSNTFRLETTGNLNGISFSGTTPAGPAWFSRPVGGAVIAGNTFSGSTQYIRARGVYDNAQFDWKSWLEQNTFENGSIALRTLSPFDVRDFSYVSGPYTFDHVRRIGTVQSEIDNTAVNGDTVLVPPANDAIEVNISKSITLQGYGPGLTTIAGPKTGGSATVRISAPNVTIDGFTITRAGNTTADWVANVKTAGIAVQGQANTGSVIRNNVITHNRTAIDINDSNGHTARNNVIVENRTGIVVRNQTDNLTVSENTITDNTTIGMLYLPGSAASSTFTNNSISHNWYAQVVDQQTGGAKKDFSGNWFGTTTPLISASNSGEPGYTAQVPSWGGGAATAPGGQPDVAGTASANVDFTPLLITGTDTDVETTAGRGVFGFQGDHGTVLVISTGNQVGTGSRVDEGTHLVNPGGTVNVLDGTYAGPVVINRPLTLHGQSTNATIISGSGTGSGIALTGSGTLSGVNVDHVSITGFDEGISSQAVSLTDIAFTDVKASNNRSYGIRLLNFVVTNASFTRVNASNNGDPAGVLGSNIGRGLIIQDGPKTNISVVDGTYNNNALSGIDINDGTVNGLTITGNQARDNGDEGIGVVGSIGPGATLVANNVVVDNGRFGIEVKNSTGNGAASGTGSLVVRDNTVTRSNAAAPNATNAAKDFAGISITRRNPVLIDGQPNQPTGAYISGNTVTGFQRRIAMPNGDGFGIVVEGVNNTVTSNTVSGNNVGVQIQSGNTADQVDPNTAGVDRGNGAPSSASVVRNSVVGNDIALRNVGAPSTPATCNWYGSAAGPLPGTVVGTFTTASFLRTSVLTSPDCPAPAAASTTIVVSAGALTGWSWLEDFPVDNAAVTPVFTAGPSGGQPLGQGSATFPTLNAQQALMISTSQFTGTRLADISSLSYSAFSTNASVSTNLQIEVELTPSATTWQGRLVFIPSGSTSGWHTWNTLDASQGGWFASKGNAPAVGFRCPLASPCTWTQVLSYWPDAQIGNPDVNNSPLAAGRVVLRAGDSSGDYHADAFAIDGLHVGALVGGAVTETVFDFEPSAPSAPTNVVAVAASTSASVSWTAPASAGTTAITGYIVTPTPAGGTCVVTGTTAACSGLTNGIPVTFAVTAVNGIGSGPSASSPAVTPLDIVASAGPVPTIAATPVAVTPSRALDTRLTKIPASGSTTNLKIAGLYGVPADAQAVLLNVTAVDSTDAGFVTVWAAGTPQPGTSNLNVERAMQTIPNMVVTPVGVNGDVSIYVQSSTQLVVDVMGYVPAGVGYSAITPQRALDTRMTTRPANGATTVVKVADVAGAPTGATSVILNLTAVKSSGPGYLTVWQTGQAQPSTSNLNVDHAGQTRPNMVIVPIGADGKVSIFQQTSADILVDVVGFFSPEAKYNAVQPSQRLLDTRTPTVGYEGAKPAANTSVTVKVAGVGSVPANAKYVIVNLTADQATNDGYVTVYPGNTSPPLASNLNLDAAGSTASNLAFVPIGADGNVKLYTQSGTHLVLDMFGWVS